MASKTRKLIARKEAAILNALYYLNDDQRKAVLRNADAKLVRRICECALNILIGNVPLRKSHKSRLRKHVKILRKLTEPTISLASKKKLIEQRGGLLTALLAPLIGAVLASLSEQNGARSKASAVTT